MTDPISEVLPAVFEFPTGMVLRGQVEIMFLPSAPLEIGCAFSAFRPPGHLITAECTFERDAMVRACLLPGLGTYGSGQYRIGRRPGDKIRIGLEPQEGSDEMSRVVVTMLRAGLEAFLRRTLDIVNIGEAEEARIVSSSLDATLEEILSSGR